MMNAKEQYEYEIKMNIEYESSLYDFMKWLSKDNHFELFKDSLRENDDYYTAVDFSIPIIMVKWFRGRI